MTAEYAIRVEAAASHLKKTIGSVPDTAVVLGSGLGAIADSMDIVSRLPYEDIPGASPTGVPSHRGQLSAALLGGHPVWLLEGRVHLYEGADIHEVVFMTRVLARAGVRRLVLTNACGGLNLSYAVSDIMLITDHINLTGVSPLEGPNNDSWGVRFPDMSAPYDPDGLEAMRAAAARNDITLREGVYIGVTGPNLETRAEYRMLRMMGADVVGMSTVPETIAGVHMGLAITGLSVITDTCDPDNLLPISIDEILAAASNAIPSLVQLLGSFLRRESR